MTEKHNTTIQWTHLPGFKGETWNPVAGCSHASPGCKHCYAERMAARLELMGITHYAGLTEKVKGKAVWTGRVKQAPESVLMKPLHWRKPRCIFVNSMGDLFHEDVQDEWIDQVFAVMAQCPQHIFIILTKRSQRMREYVTSFSPCIERGSRVLFKRTSFDFDVAQGPPTPSYVTRGGSQPHKRPKGEPLFSWKNWPLPNVWLGVSVEDQKRADERRDDLKVLADMGWRTLVSYAPALGPVDWTGWAFVRWMLSEGESGPGARPSHPDWHRAMRDFCAKHDIAYFFKQWGEWVPQLGAINLYEFGEKSRRKWVEWTDWSGKWEWAYIDKPQWCDEMDPDHAMVLVGKKKAGNMLDGRKHLKFPEVL